MTSPNVNSNSNFYPRVRSALLPNDFEKKLNCARVSINKTNIINAEETLSNASSSGGRATLASKVPGGNAIASKVSSGCEMESKEMESKEMGPRISERAAILRPDTESILTISVNLTRSPNLLLACKRLDNAKLTHISG